MPIIEFDGLCEPRNPGGVACYGWRVVGDGGPVADGRGIVREGPGATNNVAEWAALGFGLRWLADHPDSPGARGPLVLRGDSKLVVEQLAGRWACNAPALRRLRDRCRELLAEIAPESWRAEWVPREENGAADALSRRAYRERTGSDPPARGSRAAREAAQ